MKLHLALLCLGLAAAGPSLARAPQAVPLSRPFRIRVLAQGGGFSVDLPAVARTRGFSTSFFDPVEAPLTVRLTFFDPSTGAPVGTQPTVALGPGQMTQISNILDIDGRNSYQLPPDATSLIVFAEAVAGSSQIAGYVVWKDRATNDGAFVHMQESVTPF